MKTIAVLGANGRLANQVVHVFHQRGYKVVAVTRDAILRNAPDGVKVRAVDAKRRECLITACAGADVIFNGLNPRYDRWANEALPLAENVIAAAKAHGALHLFPGNVYNYGSNIPTVCTESTPFEPDHGKARVRVAVEQLFEREAEASGVKTLILRAGDFYGGTGVGAWFDLFLARDVRRDRFQYPGNPNIDHPWAYVPDLACAFADLAEVANDCGLFEQFLFEGHCLAGKDFRALMEDACGYPLKIRKTNWNMLRLMGVAVPVLREVCEMRYLWDRPHRLDGRRLKEYLPNLQNTSPAEAVREAWRDYEATLQESEKPRCA